MRYWYHGHIGTICGRLRIYTHTKSVKYITTKYVFGDVSSAQLQYQSRSWLIMASTAHWMLNRHPWAVRTDQTNPLNRNQVPYFTCEINDTLY